MDSMEEHGTYRTRTDITLPGAGAAGGTLLIVINKMTERERESVKSECIFTNNLSMQLFNPIIKNVLCANVSDKFVLECKEKEI